MLEGYVDHIVFRNEDNGYSVFVVNEDSDEITCVGNFQYLSEGEYLHMEGEYTEHQVYGEQFKVNRYEMKVPKDTESVKKYLSSGAIKGIGPAMAERIVKMFGEDTFKIIEEEPERLINVKGISEKKAMEISNQVQEKRDMRKAMIFLQQYGINLNLAVKIYKQYGQTMYTILKENPYKMADDIEGVGFKMADEIAARIGINTDSDFRIRSGIIYALSQASANGHIYMPIEYLKNSVIELLKIPELDMDNYLMDMVIDKRIVIKKINDMECVYASNAYYTELNTARMLSELNSTAIIDEDKLKDKITKLEEESGICLDMLQKKAVAEAVKNGVLVITGGPGTGKTTTINTIINLLESEQMEILLAAPTGRAAKRMKEATGHEAKTIHRLLEVSVGAESISDKDRFERNEQNPLEADVVIIDEMSMVDIYLMHSLLKAIAVGTRLILVGDVNQLPSVGPGNVLKDIISSEKFHVVKLNKIFRQASESDIVVNAHKINRGEYIDLSKRSKDFLYLKREDANKIINASLTLIKEKLPGYVGAEQSEIQVLTPMRKGMLGVERLNKILQEYLNPPSPQKKQEEIGQNIFREGDKVMQIKNDYQLEWEVTNRYGIAVEKGMGVFNGDTGIIKSINKYMEMLEVEFEEGKVVKYTFKQTEELELAYAVTIHKSQGSEYPAVILPVLNGPKMLMTRNLIYTAVTRAKKCVCIVGDENEFRNMVDNTLEQKRYSSLSERIRELE
ncbi:MAG: ATP-dependent RecD-like DNA helicase [Lachnospiraceae bacterium]|nr:ATP-dependent RecD-like DNA helicase [Lachnospiraceae bacterium]